MSKSIFSLLFILSTFSLAAQDRKEDSLLTNEMHSGHLLRFSFDASKLLLNQLVDQKSAYECAVDYYVKGAIYAVAETGFGRSNIDYPDLKYTTTNIFFRGGIDKSLFPRKKPQDWGMGFFGLRYGVGFIQRNEASYSTNDGLGTIIIGTIPSASFSAHWMELTGGMKLELFHGFFAGWTVRAKFLLNQKSFGDLKPAYIAGYGAGEKATAFDYNFFLSYALRWSAQK
jgi:hypothetical protein